CSFPVPALRPSLSLHPSQEVALGDTVTLRCRVSRPGVLVSIYKEGDGMRQWYRDSVGDMAEVHVDVSTRNFAGRYWCSCNISPLPCTLSNPVELVVLDPSFLPPVMSLSPGGRVTRGTSVTISCQSTYGATFVLHKAGRSA
ncbi:GPVI protein, partial [Crypturellus soui]|nr:GPVI protein [Crypturellus soui]